MKISKSWKVLLLACYRGGKDNVYKRLKAYHETMENMQASLFADPETVNQAVKIGPILLKQDETLIRLMQMTDEDVKDILVENKLIPTQS